jgi:hypothetical protein
METLGNDLVAKSGKKWQSEYYCEKCDYKCCKIYNWKKHISTAKHNQEILVDDLVAKSGKKGQKEYFCEKCDKCFYTNAGLWKHKTKGKCIESETNKVIDLYKNTISNKDELIITLLKQNAELIKGQQDMMVKMSENGINNQTNNHSNNHTNSHNKTFNLQFFLNEECKDALNITEFVSSIKVQLEDLETTGRLGYVEGVSRIINKNLNDLDQTKRPIHCSDVKREVLYIKNEDQWIKENETKPILTKAIKQIANENIKQISEWRKKYPDCTDSDSRKNDLYLNIVSNAMSGTTTEEQTTNYEKIITKVAREVVIEK